MKELSQIGTKMGDNITLEIREKKYRLKFIESYGYTDKGELCCLIGSGGYLEIAINQGDASRFLNVKGSERTRIQR